MSSHCNSCQKLNSSLRCSQCKQAIYCSKGCQKNDWQLHKKSCRAWKELDKHVTNLPLDEAQRRFHQVQDTIEKLVKMTELEKIATKDDQQPEKSGRTSEPKKNHMYPSDERQPPLLQATKSRTPITLHPRWRGSVEEMPYLNACQITLKPRLSSLPEDLSDLMIEHFSNGSTLVTFGDILSWKLSAFVEDYRVLRLPDCVSIRLQCRKGSFSDPVTSLAATTSSIERLVCKSCDCKLLKNIINRVVPLPSGYWDEITDYIICYPGDPAVNFGTTVVPVETAWEDSGVFVFNPDSLERIEKLQSVEPYGTHPSSSQSWQPEGRQVESLCCSYCCSTLGIATHQGYQLYKHRLGAGAVSTFVANELKRYAESQAIFTFVVATTTSSPCLLLHVVSWDSRMMDTVSGIRNRVVKVIFEESSHMPLLHEQGADLASWTWGGLDLCCAPSLTMAKQKFVILTLDEVEWEHLARNTQSNKYCFAQQVVDATILVKLGKVQPEAGLAALDLGLC